MANVNKIIGSLATAINKVSGSAISGLAKIIGATISLFSNTKSLSHGIVNGTDAVYAASTASDFQLIQTDAWSVSFWIKVGWTSSFNSTLHVISSNGPAGVQDNMWRIRYNETNNRLYIGWRSASNERSNNFWYFHHTGAGEAALQTGLGSVYWSSSNPGYVNANGFTLITLTKGTTITATAANVITYWNGQNIGDAFYVSGSNNNIEIYIIETPVWAWNGDLLPDSTEFARDIVTFYPIDLSFSEPVDISLSYSSTGNNFRLMMLEDSEDDSWEEVEGAVCSLDEFGESICEASVSSFGIFGVQEIPLSTFMENIMPETFTLHQNYPNPFNPITSLRYDLPEQAEVILTVYDLMGREVTQLVNATQEAGYRSVQWNATDKQGKTVSAGVYLYQIQAGEFVQTMKMVLLK